jgi:hypothetical protein
MAEQVAETQLHFDSLTDGTAIVFGMNHWNASVMTVAPAETREAITVLKSALGRIAKIDTAGMSSDEAASKIRSIANDTVRMTRFMDWPYSKIYTREDSDAIRSLRDDTFRGIHLAQSLGYLSDPLSMARRSVEEAIFQTALILSDLQGKQGVDFTKLGNLKFELSAVRSQLDVVRESGNHADYELVLRAMDSLMAGMLERVVADKHLVSMITDEKLLPVLQRCLVEAHGAISGMYANPTALKAIAEKALQTEEEERHVNGLKL